MTDSMWAAQAAKYFAESPERYGRALGLCAEVDLLTEARALFEQQQNGCLFCVITIDSEGKLHHESECVVLFVRELVAEVERLTAALDQLKQRLAAQEKRTDHWHQAHTSAEAGREALQQQVEDAQVDIGILKSTLRSDEAQAKQWAKRDKERLDDLLKTAAERDALRQERDELKKQLDMLEFEQRECLSMLDEEHAVRMEAEAEVKRLGAVFSTDDYRRVDDMATIQALRARLTLTDSERLAIHTLKMHGDVSESWHWWELPMREVLAILDRLLTNDKEKMG